MQSGAADRSGGPANLLKVSIASNPTTGYMWSVTQNDGALLRLLPESGFTADPTAGSQPVGAGGVQDFIFRALGAGEIDLKIGQFPPGAAEPDKTLDYPVTVVADDPALTAAEDALTTLAADPALIDALVAGDQEPAMAAFKPWSEPIPASMPWNISTLTASTSSAIPPRTPWKATISTRWPPQTTISS